MFPLNCYKVKRLKKVAQVRLTIDQIEAALKAKAGNISEAAKALGVSRTTFYRRIENSPHLQEMLTDSRESLVDIAESALLREVINGNITAIIFALKTQGKSRGYVERIEHVFPNVPLEIQQALKHELEAAGLDEQTVFRELIEAAKARRALVGTDGDSADGRAEA